MTRTRPQGRRLRVVFVDHVARLSGGEIALLRMLPSLAEKVDVHVILGEEGPLVERLRADGISVEVMPLAPDLRDLRKSTVRARQLSLRALVQRSGVRLAAAPTAPRARRSTSCTPTRSRRRSTAVLRAAWHGIPVVWHVRDRIADDYLPHGAVRLVRGAARVLPTAVVTNSEATLADAAARAQRAGRLQPGRSRRRRAARPDRAAGDAPDQGRRGREARPLEGAARLPRRVRGGIRRHDVPGVGSSVARSSARRRTPSGSSRRHGGSASPIRSSSGASVTTSGPSSPSSTFSSTARSCRSRSVRSCSRAWPRASR